MCNDTLAEEIYQNVTVDAVEEVYMIFPLDSLCEGTIGVRSQRSAMEDSITWESHVSLRNPPYVLRYGFRIKFGLIYKLLHT